MPSAASLHSLSPRAVVQTSRNTPEHGRHFVFATASKNGRAYFNISYSMHVTTEETHASYKTGGPSESKLSLCMRYRNGQVEVQFHSFLTSALDIDERLISRPGRFTTRKIKLLCLIRNKTWVPVLRKALACNLSC